MTFRFDFEPMRVLQIFNQYLEPGGEEIWANQLPELLKGRVEVEDLRFFSGDWKSSGSPSTLQQARLTWRNPDSVKRLHEAVAHCRPNALLFHNVVPVGSLALYQEAASLGLPVLSYTHNFRPFSPSGTLWARGRINESALHGNPWAEVGAAAWEKSLLKTFLLAVYQQRWIRSGGLGSVNRWITISRFMKKKFMEAGVPEDRISLLRHCWKTSPPIRNRDEGNYYLYLGRLVSEKGVGVALDAWSLLEQRYGDACPRLVFAGRGPLEREVMKAARRSERVTHVGYIDGETKRDLTARARAVVAPSLWSEPLGLIVYEAYDSCRPVLAAARGGLIETVQDGVTGHLHRAGDAEQLANDVWKLEEAGPARRGEMGWAGRRWLEEHASPERWAEDFVRIIDQVSSEVRK